ncbi:hemerythrin domain-containing protein [Actinomadura sp. HBU206391]|uniref:hemerythrin domain-containing protein n=1 Tax=Actinomadura sp. HBU206391 TaxID=2731692 RepID=UPI00164F1591|nr:hemerythrin domain-containing protein [Actinomadura sp. HBU206391]MBC6459742.1 hemerythrin domain-containing protein [Actinomadura sp. HBU206391]
MTSKKTGAGPPGEHLVKELKWVHGRLRKDLRVLRELAAQIGSNASPALVRTKIRTLRTQSPLWQLRVNCLKYCRFVHGHHGGEDVNLFPALRRSNPALVPTVKRLEADHRKISDLLDQVEALARVLGDGSGTDTRERLVAAIDELSRRLLEHLDFEEKSISPTLRTWTTWPG